VKLDRLAVKKIVVKFVAELQTSLQAKNIRLSMSEALIDHLADQGYDSRMGARPLSRKIDELVRVPLSRKILFDGLRDCAIRADMQDGQVVFNSVADVTTGVNEHGIIVVGTDEN
jgi:ATP-dependent Clp protease ATP-binding subunit ClpA